MQESGGVEIPKGVSSIGDKAFVSCKELYMVTIPETVTYVGKHIFNFCDFLEHINIASKTQMKNWHTEWLGDCRASINY